VSTTRLLPKRTSDSNRNVDSAGPSLHVRFILFSNGSGGRRAQKEFENTTMQTRKQAAKQHTLPTMTPTRLSHAMRLLDFFLLAMFALVGVPLCKAFVASPRSSSMRTGPLLRAPTVSLRLYRGDEDDPFMPCEAARNGVFNPADMRKGQTPNSFQRGPQGEPLPGNRYDINGNDMYDRKPSPQGPPPAVYSTPTPTEVYREEPKAFKSFARNEAKARTIKTAEVIEVPYHRESPMRERLEGWQDVARRKMQEYRQKLRRGERAIGPTVASGTSTLIRVHSVFFAYQCLTTLVCLLGGRYGGSRNTNPAVAAVTGIAAISAQPLTKDWMFSTALARWQPHRYITSGFAHSGLLSLLLNVDALRRLPGWLEKTSGSAVYLTTFLLSSVAGHLGHAAWGGRGVSLGASGGICGLYGLYVVSLLRRTKSVATTTREVWVGLGRQLIYGLSLSHHGSTASHLVGFVVGMMAAFAFTFDHTTTAPRLQGSPKASTLALWSTWVVALTALVLVPTLRPIPGMIVQSLFRPGSLTPARFL
jgi:membrane associated rhomboid family serine protease